MDIIPDLFSKKRDPVLHRANIRVGGSTAAVAEGIAVIPYGGVGSYVIAYIEAPAAVTVFPGTVFSGNTLRYYVASTSNNYTALNAWAASSGTYLASSGLSTSTLSLSGSWRLMTYIINTSGGSVVPIAGLFVRII